MNTVKEAAASSNGAVMCAAEKKLGCKVQATEECAAAGCQRAASWGERQEEENLSREASTVQSRTHEA